MYRVVAVRTSGEQLLVSEHATGEMAQKVVNLINNNSGFKEVRIDNDGARRHRRGRRRRP
jgi:hypothetical protein